MSRERQLGDGRIDARVRRAGHWLGHIDEYRFAVTQFGRYPLPLAGLGLTGVDDAEGIAEAAVLVGENAQHCHVDGHVADATWSESGGAALVGAHRVEDGDSRVDGSGDGAFTDAGAQQAAKEFLVVYRRIGGIDEPLDNFDEAVRIVMEREMPGAFEDLQL